MSAVKKLRAVEPSERARKKLSVADAADSGDHRALLVAMRERIALAVADPECAPRDLAALTRRLQDISKEIESIDLRLREEGADADALEGDEEFDPSAL